MSADRKQDGNNMLSFFKKKNFASINDTALLQLLQSKKCDKCQRNCQLSFPKCHKGKDQAEILMKNYALNR